MFKLLILMITMTACASLENDTVFNDNDGYNTGSSPIREGGAGSRR